MVPSIKQKQVPIISPDGKTRYVDYGEFLQSLTYSNLAQVKLRNLNSSESNPTYRKFNKEQIVKFLGNPAASEKQLRDMSIYLYNISNYYRRLIQYFANMSVYAYIVSPYGLDRTKAINKGKFKRSYFAALAQLEKMNLRHEFTKIMTVVFREDVYYGVAWETGDSFTFQKLDPDYCKISSAEDGVYNFAFDFSYFDSNVDKLANYPPEFFEKYALYKTGGQTYKWQELNSATSICLKMNESDVVPIPPFVALFSALADIEDYRAISKNATEANNYKALALEIPISQTDGAFLLDYDLCKDFYNMLCSVLPSNIGAIMSPMRISSWNFERSGVTSDTNEVAKSEASMWQQAGVNKILFGGGEDPSASTLELCTVNDQMIVFGMMRQVERWINRKLKQMSTAYHFKVSILDVTIYNREKMHSQYLKDGQYGLPVRSAIMATQGFSPSDMEGMYYLENSILELPDKEIPLTSSNTQSASEGGRPTNAENGEGLSESGNTSADRQG